MAYRETIQIGNPLLKADNKNIQDFLSSELHSLVKDMADSMRKDNLIGLAAPQLGENLKLFITEPRKTKFRSEDQADELRVYINPKIVELSEEEVIIYEGCGSVAKSNLFAPVKRPKVVTIEAYDLEGKKFRMKADGILGRVIQHEYDHLIGVEFIEKIYDYTEVYSRENFRKYISGKEQFKKDSFITVKDFEYIN